MKSDEEKETGNSKDTEIEKGDLGEENRKKKIDGRGEGGDERGTEEPEGRKGGQMYIKTTIRGGDRQAAPGGRGTYY